MDLKRNFPSRIKILESFRDNPLKDLTRHPHHKIESAVLSTYGVPFMRYDLKTGRYVVAQDAEIPKSTGQAFRRDAIRYFPFAVRLPHLYATWYDTQQYYDAPENQGRPHFDSYRKDAEHYFKARPHKEEVAALQEQLAQKEKKELQAKERPPDAESIDLLLYEYFNLPSADHYCAYGLLRSPYGTDALLYRGLVIAKPLGRHMLVIPPVTMHGKGLQGILDKIYDRFPEDGRIVPCIPPPEDERGFLDGIGGAMRLIAQTLAAQANRTHRAERLARYYSLLLRCTRKPAYTPTDTEQISLKRFGAYRTYKTQK